jgi:hypothetical protein
VLALAGLAGVGLAVVLVGLLHVVAPEVDPVGRTISEYALGGHRPLFDVGVLGLSAGSVLVLAAAVRARLLHRWSVPAVLVAVWAVALVAVVVFEKTNWAVGPSVSGYIHRYASLAAFASLPVAAVVIGLRRRADAPYLAVWLRWSGTLALLLLAAIVVGVVIRVTTGAPVWQYLPLGLTERALALVEVSIVVVLGTWTQRAGTAPARDGTRAVATAATPAA